MWKYLPIGPIFIMLLFFPSIMHGQFGITLGYAPTQQYSYEGLEQDLDYSNWQIIANYWFRLKNTRIEFLPELFWRRAKTNFPNNESSSYSSYGLGLITQIYFLELRSDCDCPTFSKENDLIKKGLFFQIDPEIAIVGEHGLDDINLGLGIGLDIGLSDLVTITPYFQYLVNLVDPDPALSPDQFLVANIRFTFRPDY